MSNGRSFQADDRSDNPAWSALTTHQAHLALGGDLARRYPPHLAPIAALGRRDRAALEELATLVPEGDSVSLPATLESVVPIAAAATGGHA